MASLHLPPCFLLHSPPVTSRTTSAGGCAQKSVITSAPALPGRAVGMRSSISRLAENRLGAWKVACSGSQSKSRPSASKTSSSAQRSEEHTSELQSLMRISYAVLCLKKKKEKNNTE